MFGSTILELAISMVFIYLVFSLVCSGIKEWLHYLLNIRSKTLEEAIRKMLKSSALVKGIYSHNLVREVSQTGIFKKMVFSPEKTAAGGEGLSMEGEDRDSGEKPVNIAKESFSNALVECIIRLVRQKDDSEESRKAFEDIKQGVEEIVNHQVRKLLTDLMVKAEDKEAELKKEAEQTVDLVGQWFDSHMNKLSAWYKKKSRYLIFTFALIFTVLFNVDSIMLIKNLSQNPELRKALVSQAETLSDQQPDYMKKRGTNSDQGMDTDTFFEEYEALKSQLRNSGIPLGWVKAKKGAVVKDPRAVPQTVMEWIYKVIGLLISLMAIGMGAPFWFDALKYLIGLQKRKPGSQSSEDEQDKS
jgi:hypothetical protein